MIKTFLVLVIAATFVMLTSASLPPVVASHFVAGGAANGFTPRDIYVKLMLGLVIGLPLLTALMGITSRIPARFVNLPHRDYWLAPERVDETFAYLRSQGSHFAILLMIRTRFR